MSSSDAVDGAKQGISGGKNRVFNRLEKDGVVSPARLALAVSGALYIVGVPITSFLTQPHGLVERAVNGVCNDTVYAGSFGAISSVSQTSKIAALSALFITVTYAFSGAASSAGVDAAHREGRDNHHPRAQTRELKGLPLRLHSAHYHLMETFPGFALSAALAQVMAPGDQTLINLLGLHVICKAFVFWPAYALNLAMPRSLAHYIGTSCMINVAWRLAKLA